MNASPRGVLRGRGESGTGVSARQLVRFQRAPSEARVVWLLGILVVGIVFELGLNVGRWEGRNDRRWKK